MYIRASLSIVFKEASSFSNFIFTSLLHNIFIRHAILAVLDGQVLDLLPLLHRLLTFEQLDQFVAIARYLEKHAVHVVHIPLIFLGQVQHVRCKERKKGHLTICY